jgi:hypothetical protein
METEFPMDDMIAVRRAVDRLLGGDLGPMLDLLAEDVEFEVAGGGDSPERRKVSGKQAVTDHFTALGDLVAFWQIDYGAVDGQVIAWGKESFTVEHCGLEGACEFALVFDLARSKITRFLVIEDLTSFFRRDGSLVEAGRRGAQGPRSAISRPAMPSRVRTGSSLPRWPTAAASAPAASPRRPGPGAARSVSSG